VIIAALTALALVGSVPPSSEPIPDGYVPIVDATDTIVVAAPEAWTETDVSLAPTEGAGEVPRIAASPDLMSFYTSFDTPGVLFVAFPYTINPLDYVDQFGEKMGCASMEIKEYEDPIFIGVIQIGMDCGPQHMIWNMVVASPADEAYTAVVQVQTVDDVQRQTVIRTFNSYDGAPTSTTGG